MAETELMFQFPLGLIKEKKLSVSCNGPKKYRVGRSVIFFPINFLVKKVFYACFMHVFLKGRFFFE